MERANVGCLTIVNSKTVLCFETIYDRFMGFNKFYELYLLIKDCQIIYTY